MNRLALWMTLAALLLPCAARAAQDCGYDIYIVIDPDEAIAECTKSLAQEQQVDRRSRMLVHRGSAYQRKKDGARALADFNEALRLDPASDDAYFNRSSYQQYIANDVDAALADLSQAIRINPSYPYYSARGSLYAEQGKLEPATADYDASLKLNPKNSGDLIARGTIWRHRGDYQKALADFDEAVKVSPTFSNALNARSQATAMVDLGGAFGPTSLRPSSYTRSAAFTIGSYTAEVWSLDGKPHHCAVTASYGEPASAFGRSAAAYAMTLASSQWGFAPATSYPVTVSVGEVDQVSTASAIDASTVGIPIAADAAFLAAWHRTYKMKVKAATSTIEVDGSSNSVLDALDECWKRASQAVAANPFGPATPAAAAAPASNPFAPPPAPAAAPTTQNAMPDFMRRLLGSGASRQ